MAPLLSGWPRASPQACAGCAARTPQGSRPAGARGICCQAAEEPAGSKLQRPPSGRLASLIGNRGSHEASTRCDVDWPSVSGRRSERDDPKQGSIEELLLLIKLLPASIQDVLTQRADFTKVMEIVLDLGRAPLARFPQGDVKLSDSVITQRDLDDAIAKLGEFGGDNRAGIDRTLHRIACLRNRDGAIVGLTCRAGRSIPGSAALVRDLVNAGRSILFLGRPGVGKTTAIREVARQLADGCRKRVVVVDTSNEIGGDGDIPHPGIGAARRMQVPVVEEQHHVMIEAVENHMPEVIIIDEIGVEAEALAARTVAQRGVQLVATAHGGVLATLAKNPALTDLVGGISSVTLGDDEARRRGGKKSVQERAGPPCFDAAVEMLDRRHWRIHTDLGAAVDRLLAGHSPGGEIRMHGDNGEVLVVPDSYAFDLEGLAADIASPTTFAASSSPAPTLRPRSPSPLRAAAPAPQPALTLPAANFNDYDAAAAFPSAGALPPTPLVPNVPPVDLVAGIQPAVRRASSQQRDAAEEAVRCAAEAGASAGPGSAAEEYAMPGAAGYGRHSGVIRIFPYHVEAQLLHDVLAGLGLEGDVVLTDRLEEADTILALRMAARGPGCEELRAAARAAGVPIYAVRAATAEHLVRALRALMGIDPSALPLRDPGSAAAAGHRAAALRCEDDLARMARGGERSNVVSRAVATNRGAALAEVRAVVEGIVLPQRTAAELKPRAAEVRSAQAALVASYDLAFQLVGAGANMRLRIMPAPTPAPLRAAQLSAL